MRAWCLMGGQCLLLVVGCVYHYVGVTVLSSISNRRVAGCYAWMRGSVSLSGEEGSLLSTPVGTLDR